MTKKDKQDQQVLDLIERVKSQKKELDSIKRPLWKTSCSLLLPHADNRINIQICKDLVTLASARKILLDHLQAMEHASSVWGIDVDTNWQKYSISAWVSDIDLRVKVLAVKSKQDKFDTLSARLDALLTPEQKREIELELIAKDLEK